MEKEREIRIISLLLFLICVNSYTLSGQRYINGKVVDNETGDVIPNVSVFFANTTVGTFTDPEGLYKLKIPGEGSYVLTLSHAAYEPVFINVEPGKSSMEQAVVMYSSELKEVEVVKKVRIRQRDVDFFWKTILGRLPSKEKIFVTNPQAAYYYYNPQTRKLKVTCKEPLHIMNLETGYQIKFILYSFTYGYDTEFVSWDGQFFFEELPPENDVQKNRWEENRKAVYQFSVTKFIRALYEESIMENGFLLTYTENRLFPGSKSGFVPPLQNIRLVDLSKFLLADSVSNGKTLYIPPDMEKILLVCYGKTINRKDLEQVMFVQNGRIKWKETGVFRNELRTQKGPVRVFKDGTFDNALYLSPMFNSHSITGLVMQLPLDYQPNLAQKNPAEIGRALKKVQKQVEAVNYSDASKDDIIRGHAIKRFFK